MTTFVDDAPTLSHLQSSPPRDLSTERSLPPGVYFDLPEEDYHASFALSASSIKHLRASPLDFWARSILNPDREDEATEAKTIGKAYHKRIVEGREAFWRCYAAALDPGDYPGAARTAEDLKALCKTRGLTVGGAKADLVARLVAHEPGLSGIIWESLISLHASEHEGKELLPRDLIHKIEMAAAHIEKHPQLGKAFSGGYPEVSIFWVDRETGVPMKARLDYLKPRAIVDLKTFENVMGLPVSKAIARAVAHYKLHIQAALYLEAVREARLLIEHGLVFGEHDKHFVNVLAGSADPTFLFVFQQKGVAPLARGKVLERGTVLDIGRLEIDQAKALFARCWKTYGADPWLDVSEVETFDSTEFPAYLAD